MKITVYSAKWSAGKTPIATNMALDREYAVGTNELYHIYDGFIPDNRLIATELDSPFPVIDDSIDIVFDLAGSISKTSLSITSAISQSNVVLVPIYNELQAIKAGVNTIAEILPLNTKVVVIATKPQKRNREDRQWGWQQCEDYRNIKKAVGSLIDEKIPVLPLKFLTVFTAMIEQEKSISQLMSETGLAKYHYQEVAEQFNEIYKLIDTQCAK